ncbi:ASCH domain-containing protein [Arsenicicoccus sp. oral taxon 190]|uniref:ASCH domain-containing protein n=1 Tax=Arsenicicoccus sp. oral taxon 190 TaxID=1658671 RepID=UPI00067A0D4F|nr:ASCH domain-containing protein [Arsenicicoccus sp. oral taxon 190]AKT52872.1 hypothetical protein ADJ73_13920 [Arsenicicoccus sp. oral taxon 190]
MDDRARSPEPHVVDAFWADARVRSGLAGEEIYQGRSSAAALCPPAWAFGDSRRMADELCRLVLDGTKTATAGAWWEFGDEPLPDAGELSIVCDGDGRPRALLRLTRVRRVRFDEVDAEHARAEGEGDRSLESWRRDHQAFFERIDDGEHPFRPDMEVVLQEFEVLARA